MRVKIVDVPVRQNVELFLEILRRAKQKLPKKQIPSEKIFSAWLNRETGQLVFGEIGKESLYMATEKWKPMEISYRFDADQGEIHFLIDESESSTNGFRYDDLTGVAYGIMRQTMVILNDMCKQLKGPSDLDTKLAVLTKVSIDSSVSHVDHNVLIEAWHLVDRFGAEALLLNKSPGSYLFRRDPYCEILEQQLQEVHKKEILCFTLTHSQFNKKISDYTIVYCDGKWQCYDDDPSLQQPCFEELTALLAQWKDQLKYPLYRS